MRKSLGAKYLIHFYGPYSPEVTEALAYLTTFGLAKEAPKETPDFVRYDLVLTPEGEEYTDRLYKDLTRRSREQIDRMTKQAAELNTMPLKRVISMAYAQAGSEKII